MAVVTFVSIERTAQHGAGSYGKSTTTAILAHILSRAGVKSGYFIGAEPLSLPAPSKLGEGIFVVEGDEYPSAHGDPRAKCMHLHPHDIVLTSVVHDHVNVYPSQEAYEKPFRELLAALPLSGRVVVCADEPNALRLATESGKDVVTYGLLAGDYRAVDIAFGERTQFSLVKDDRIVGRVSTTLLGRHNIEDIVAAAAFLLPQGIVTFTQFVDGVETFSGVRRRLDRVAPSSSVLVYEGFGSSYEKAVSAINALRLHFPDKSLVVVFEPHTFGWRNRANLRWYQTVFRDASLVFVAPPTDQGALTHDQLSHQEIISAIENAGTAVRRYYPNWPAMVSESVGGQHVVLVLTSGHLDGSLQALLDAFAQC